MWDADLAGGLALVFGADGRGLRPLVRRTCDGAVRIPLAGRAASLDVGSAAALLLYEARRQRSRG
jgi:23S rRNA (guanosine2251-2'-O)-methyltransferase